MLKTSVHTVESAASIVQAFPARDGHFVAVGKSVEYGMVAEDPHAIDGSQINDSRIVRMGSDGTVECDA